MSLADMVDGDDEDLDAVVSWVREHGISTFQLTLLALIAFALGLWLGTEYAWRTAYIYEYPVLAMFGTPVSPDAKVWVDPLREFANRALWAAFGGLLVLGAIGLFVEDD